MRVPEIRQIVPPEWCFKCDVCCRFPESTSFLAPYFSGEEIASAIESDAFESHFPNKAGCRITLIPGGEAYICPVFDPLTAHCRIYKVRPFDCVLYPFAIMWNPSGEEVILGLDTKCPYAVENMGMDSISDSAVKIGCVIESYPQIDIITANPGLIGPFQDDVIPLIVLENLSNRF